MPKCEGQGGIPLVPCPKSKNDNSVKFTQGDLFLCDECDYHRFGVSSNITNSQKSKGSKKSNVKVSDEPKPTNSSAEQSQASNMNKPTQLTYEIIPNTVPDTTEKTHVENESKKTMCRKCRKEVRTNSNALECEICDEWFHIECVGVKKEFYAALVKDGSLSNFSWYCDDCKRGTKKLFTGIQNLSKKYDCLHGELSNLKHDVNSIEEEVGLIKTVCDAHSKELSSIQKTNA